MVVTPSSARLAMPVKVTTVAEQRVMRPSQRALSRVVEMQPQAHAVDATSATLVADVADAAGASDAVLAAVVGVSASALRGSAMLQVVLI